ncbi:MAG: hypothetical protein H7A51_02335 [Akkermansiaceae bacterium]|nr:hypothetical protein [Akkermansiaceae bacterium]
MSGSSQLSQASFPCQHCQKSIYIPAGLPPTTAPCPHCGKEVTSPDQNLPAVPAATRPVQENPVDQPVRLEAPAKGRDRPAQIEDLVETQLPGAGGNQRRRKGNMAAVIAAVLILLVAGGVTFWLAQKWKKDKQTLPSSDSSTATAPLSEEQWRTTGWKDEAFKVLSGFMTAKSPIDRMKYVIPNEGVMDELEMFYPEGSDDSDTPKESFGYVMGSELDHKRGIFLMQYRQPAQIDMREYFAPIGSLDRVLGQEPSTLMEMAYRIDEDNLSKPIGINAFFKKTDQGLKLDASVFIQGKFRTFRAFVDYPRPGKTQVFRVVASEALSHELRDDKRYRTYRLEDFAYPKDYVNVPVLVESETGRILSELNWRGMNRDRKLRTATVELGWSNESPSKLQIVKIVCWEFLGVGGEAGNTAPEAPVPPAGGGH